MNIIKNYNAAQSPTGLSVRRTRAYERGRDSIGAQRIVDQQLDREEVIERGKAVGRRAIRRNLAIATASIAAAVGTVELVGPSIDAGLALHGHDRQAGQVIPKMPEAPNPHPNVIVEPDGTPTPMEYHPPAQQ